MLLSYLLLSLSPSFLSFVSLSLMVDPSCMHGINSMRKVSKAYKSVLRKWFPRKKSSSSLTAEDNHQNQTQQQDHVEDQQEGETMNGIHSFKYNGDVFRGNDPMSSRRSSLYRHRSIDGCFPSLASLSRNESRIHTPSMSSSRSNYDSVPTPSSGSLRTPSALLSKNASKSASRRSTTPIMFSNSSGMLKPPPIEKKLECTLEELCYGCKKKIKVTRDVLTNAGRIVQEDELFTIKLKPGWKKGTKITFEGKGNGRPGGYREDIIFSISEKRHHLFRRQGDDLELAVEIPLLKALAGSKISVPLLGGEQMNLTMDEIVYPGYEKIIIGQGMPISKEPGKRGNLKVTFLVKFPKQLTDEQRSDAVSILQNSC